MIGEKRNLEPSSGPCKYARDDPLYPLYNPETVNNKTLPTVVTGVFECLRTLTFFHSYENLYETSLLALRTWKELPFPENSKLHQLFINILVTTEKFCIAPRDLIHLQLADGNTIPITVQQMNTLILFSDTLDKLWTDNWKEKKAMQLTLNDSTINKEILVCIVNLLLNTDYQIPKNISILHVLSAVEFLQILHLSAHLVTLLMEHIQTNYLDIESILSIFDYALYQLPNKKELINKCFDGIHHYICCRETHALPESFIFQSPALKRLDPGLRALVMNKNQKAVELMTSIPEPKDDLERLFFAIAAIAAKDDSLEITVEENCSDYRWWVLRAQYSARHSPEQTEPYIEKVKKLRSDHLFIHGIEGSAHKRLQDSIAIDCFKLQIKATPEALHWSFQLARAHRFRKESQKAITIYEEILKKNPNHLGALQKSAYTNFSRKKYDEAIKRSDLCIAINKKKSSRAYETKINSLESLLRYKEALKCAEEALEVHPSREYIILSYLDVLLTLKRLDKASALIEKLNKKNLCFFFYSAWLALLQKDFSKVEKLASEANSLKRNDLQIEILQCYQFALQRKKEEFLVLEPKMKQPHHLAYYVRHLFPVCNNENEKALEGLKNCRNSNTSINHLELEACALYNLNRPNEAKQVVDKILLMDPDYPLPQELKALMKLTEVVPIVPQLL